MRNKLIYLSLLQKDKPYVHGGHGPDYFDCAGLVWYLYNEILGIDIYEGGIGESTSSWIMTCIYGDRIDYPDYTVKKDLSRIVSGDILFFHRQAKDDNYPCEGSKYPGHCGIYLENDLFIHCSGRYMKVTINSLIDDIYWRKILVGSKNIIDNEKILIKK